MINLSVVTICFNNPDDVKQTCASVDMQTVKPFEHLIVNGSTDPAIKEWLENNSQPAYRRWVNVENKGIAGNFNQGIEHSKGSYIHLLNSGDIYSSAEVVENVLSFLQKHLDANWISCNIILYRGGDWVTVGCPFDRNQLYKGMRRVSHPSWFVKREVYDRLGLYKPYSIAMDYDMMCRIKDEPYAYLNFTIAKFDNTGVSSVKYLDSLKQNIQVYESNFGYSLKCRIWQFRQKLLYKVLQTSLGEKLFKLKAAIKG